MKPIRIVLSPTRSRPLNVFLGLVLLLASLLLFLSLATYHASDPSMNTATDLAVPHAVRNWVGLSGAWIGDLLLQCLGFTAFFLPLWLGGIGWTWMRSPPGGSPWPRVGRYLSGFDLCPCGLWPASLALALAPCAAYRGRCGPADGRAACDLPEHPGRLAGGCCPGWNRTLLCQRRELLGDRRKSTESVDSRRLVA